MVHTIIFDVDGVLVDSPHEQAWGDTLADLMENDWPELRVATGFKPSKYTSVLYQREVAGKPRMDGARALLRAFGLPDDDEHAHLLADRKQTAIADLIRRGAFRAFDDAITFLLKAKASGIKIAAASSSKNANAMMAKVHLAPFGLPKELDLKPDVTLLDVLDTNVSGRDIRPGKPDPAMFLTAAKEAGVDPAECVVVEDSPAGVVAGKAAGSRCIGVARLNDEAFLQEAKADWVVTSLDSLTPAEL